MNTRKLLNRLIVLTLLLPVLLTGSPELARAAVEPDFQSLGDFGSPGGESVLQSPPAAPAAVGGEAPFGAGSIITTTADGAHSVYAADVDGDGDLDVLSASLHDDKIAWYENDGALSPVFTSHVITTAADYAISVYAADVDGDGDLDVLSASNDDRIAWYENRGGQFALATTDTAPATILEDQRDDLLRIVAVHRGQASDMDAELATLELLFEESAGDPLTTAEANNMIENLHIYRDDGSGSFEPGADTLVTTASTLSLVAGTQTATFADGDPNVQLSVGTPVTYFVVAELTGDAASQTVNQFRVTHVTESSSTAEDRDHDLPLTLEFAPNVASGIVSAASRTCYARLNDAPTDYTTVQAAVDAANEGDVVKVAGYATASLTMAQAGLVGSGRVYLLALPSAAIVLRGVHSGMAAALLSLFIYGGFALAARRREADSPLALRLELDEGRLPEEVAIALFRVFQEGLSNVERHAQASAVEIGLALTPAGMLLTIRDDGCGFAVPRHLGDLAQERCLGLLGARERVEALGGGREVISRPGEGTLLRAWATGERLWVGEERERGARFGCCWRTTIRRYGLG